MSGQECVNDAENDPAPNLAPASLEVESVSIDGNALMNSPHDGLFAACEWSGITAFLTLDEEDPPPPYYSFGFLTSPSFVLHLHAFHASEPFGGQDSSEVCLLWLA
eukprot:766384-Hanusia_phi.AAC.2